DRYGINSADGAIEVDPAEDLDAGDSLADEVGERCSRFPMTLEDERAHAPLFGEAGKVDRVDGAGDGVGGSMGVDVDDSAEGLGVAGDGEQGEEKSAHR